MMDAHDEQQAIAATQRWLEAAVIGLNLCPFARGVMLSGRIRYRTSRARDPEALRADLSEELRLLVETPASTVETTLLIHPWVLTEFLDFNDFLLVAEATVAELGLTGEFQVASFHPHYQFAGTRADDTENCTNRAPFPTLHLLREESIERALANFPDPSSIYRDNIETMRRLGKTGWQRLQTLFACDFSR